MNEIMESLLRTIADNTEKIARNTCPKFSCYVCLSEKSTRIRTKCNHNLNLDKDKKYEMALVNLETYYSFPNIDAKNNNFKYSPDDGKTWFNVDIPEGCYEITDINDYIQRIMEHNEHCDVAKKKFNITIEPNKNTLKCVLDVRGTFRVKFTTENSIRTVLGFERKEYTAGYHESENIVNIININSLRVTCDIIGASYSNGKTENTIYSFFPDVGPGYKIIEVPTNLVYLPVTLNKISAMETKLTDQDGKLINLNGEELSLRFHIKEK